MSTAHRILEVQKSLSLGEPSRNKVLPRKRSDFPGVPAVYLDMAERLGSPLLMGPPLCEQLVAMVRHLFTEEEAGAARHLRPFLGKSAASVAKAERRAVDQIAPILNRLANEKQVIVSAGSEGRERYLLMPICPGMFEMVLIRPRPGLLTDWHHRFAELFEELWLTGYSVDYAKHLKPMVRYLPVGQALDAHPMALPTDKLEALLDQYDAFAVAECQCRVAMQVLGKGCGKPTGNCMMMGEWALKMIERGSAREVSKREALAIKREAESHGMVNWMMNVAASKGQSSCSCCGCCCHAMRTVSEMNAPGMIAPPHFVPRFDLAKCVCCGKCAAVCPMKAIAVDAKAKTLEYHRVRCIGCGLCLLQCDKRRAIAMDPVPAPEMPYRSWFTMMLHSTPGMAKAAWNHWRKYR